MQRAFIALRAISVQDKDAGDLTPGGLTTQLRRERVAITQKSPSNAPTLSESPRMGERQKSRSAVMYLIVTELHMRTTQPASGAIVDLISLIYAGSAGGDNTREVLSALNSLVNAAATQLITWRQETGTVLHCDAAGSLLEPHSRDYMTHWGPWDPRVQWLAREPVGQVMRCHEHFDPKFVGGNSFFQDFFLPRGGRWSLCASYRSAPGVMTVIASARIATAPPFEEWTARTVKALLPHFERTAAISLKLDQASAAVQSATHILQHLPSPCLVTDHAGRCMEANGAFSQALEPLAMRLATGRVRFTDPNQQSRWETALFETHATALEQTMQFVAANGKPWSARLVPWHSPVQKCDSPDKKLILAIFEEAVPQGVVEPGSMASTARLTRAEAEVLAGLLKGLPAKAIASYRSASVNTVRTQIVAILEKTGFNSQKELMASFSNSTLPESVFGNSTHASQN